MRSAFKASNHGRRRSSWPRASTGTLSSSNARTPASNPIHTFVRPRVVPVFAGANPKQPGMWRTGSTVKNRSCSQVF
jgi:hypothetical protein